MQSKRFIRTETSAGHQIENEQYPGLGASALSSFVVTDLKRRYHGLQIRNNPTDCYNCHGMTFASRRTGIYDTSSIYEIIKDDEYHEIAKETVLPGDIVLYYGEGGDIEHSGLVISKTSGAPEIPIIISKWGMAFEAIHSVYSCPYNMGQIKFYRCNL